MCRLFKAIGRARRPPAAISDPHGSGTGFSFVCLFVCFCGRRPLPGFRKDLERKAALSRHEHGQGVRLLLLVALVSVSVSVSCAYPGVYLSTAILMERSSGQVRAGWPVPFVKTDKKKGERERARERKK